MLEAKITIEAPGLEAAINNLATAISGAKQTDGAAASMPAAPVNSATVPLGASVPVAGATAAAGSTTPHFNGAPMPAPQAASMQAPVQNYPTPGVPLAQPPQYTIDQIMTAGAALMDAGKVTELMNLLHSFGVQAVTELKPEQLGAFATAMRELGAKI